MQPRHPLREGILAIAITSSTLLLACSHDVSAPPPPTTGTIAIDVKTTGTDIDSDGFVISVDGVDVPVPANGTVKWTGSAGSHSLSLSGLAFNCDITTPPTSAVVSLGQTTHVAVAVSCAPYLSNVIVYTSEEFGLPEVMAMRPDGSRRVRLTTDQAGYAAPVVSPDGNTIAVAAHIATPESGIYLLDRFGKSPVKLVSHSSFDGSPAWSPDGTKLAFRSELSGPYGPYGRIFVINRDGTGLRQLSPETASYTFDDGPAWSPDGTQVVYSNNGTLTVINADGSSPTSLGIGGSYPAWSPDGAKLTFHWWNVANTIEVIFVADRTGAHLRQLTTPAEGDQMARWSPDGQQIVFERVESQQLHIYRMAADGTGATKLTTVNASEGWASWTPRL